ncbi:M56 family metallopeptidase [Kitasatospora herbaricolor]|uniref:M56 family metallopeptidase n=1 Tax=Kitasatospora herbaricolor TaxID=68217 RepID=A0ABZ1W6B3_9ACTN|nr:M56 family metallopeptidase [Kitasatospora herbaricolor]
MTVAVWVPLLLPFLAAPAARLLARELPPPAAARILTGTSALLAAATLCSLGLLAAAGLLRLPPVAALGHLSPHWIAAGAPGGAPAAGLAGLALATAAALALRIARRHRRDLAHARAALGDPARPARSLSPGALAAFLSTAVAGPAARLRSRGRPAAPAEHPLAVLADDRADAFALPGRPGRVVVTGGMLRALSAPERAALFAHERAHLTGRHHLFLAAAEYAAVVHPALRTLRAPIGYQLERWADEAAAAAVGDRTVTARAVGRAALAAGHAPRPDRPGLAPAAHAGPVPRRVAALLDPCPRPRTGRRAAAFVLAACLSVTLTAALDATTDLHRAVEAAQSAGAAGR